MRDTLSRSLRKLQKNKKRRRRLVSVLLVLSLLVAADVFWTLRRPGVTLAGDAACGKEEHTHSELCRAGPQPCEKQEHIHSVECYSDDHADAETSKDWMQMFSQSATGDLPGDLVSVAVSQIGYRESTRNFRMDTDGSRRGYTRYGAWYGVPYNDWSSTFVSFCLHWAGAEPEQTPYNIGANSMAMHWSNQGLLAEPKNYMPLPGDLVFFADNTVAVVTAVNEEDVTLVQGDVDGAVVQRTVSVSDPGISGWGMTPRGESGQDSAETTPAEPTEAPDSGENSGYLLPETGGPGIFLYLLWGSVLIGIPFVFACSQLRRQEGRHRR